MTLVAREMIGQGYAAAVGCGPAGVQIVVVAMRVGCLLELSQISVCLASSKKMSI